MHYDADPYPPELDPDYARPTRRRFAGLLAVALTVAAAALLWHHDHHSRIAVQEVSAAELQDGPPVPRASYGRIGEPASNTVLHGAGQTDFLTFAAYSNAVAPNRPTVFMTYVDLRDDLPGFFAHLKLDLNSPVARAGSLTPPAQLDEPAAPDSASQADAPSDSQPSSRFSAQSAIPSSARSKPQATPELIPQIGLSLNHGESGPHYEAETARGADDTALAALCTGLNSLDRPIFLRIGYEFNGPWNKYLPTPYVAAFRRVSARVHGCAPRVAVVWDWSADAELDVEAGGNPAPAASRWQPFYPGDDAVDWWALNLFTAASIRSAATEQFLQAAAASSHPVMIAESTPKGYSVARSSTVWADWFAPYFALVHTHPGIRAFCYINWNWAGYPQWADWGDARIETAPPAIQQQLRNELNGPLYTTHP